MKTTKSILVLLCVILSSCSMKKAATTMTANIVIDGMSAVESESDLWVAGQSVVPMVKILEVFREGDPNNMEFNGLMAKVYGNIAFGFFEPEYLKAKGEEKSIWKGRMERYYRLGYEAGTESLRARFGKKIDGGVHDFESAISKANKKDMMVLFWTAFDLGNWVGLNRDDITSVAKLPRATAMMDKVLELDPKFGFGSALAFKAAMLASRPKMLGGNPEEAKKLFEESDQISSGKYLMAKVMFAEWYAIPQDDKALSKELLMQVANGDPTAIPEQALANKLAIERAIILMHKN